MKMYVLLEGVPYEGFSAPKMVSTSKKEITEHFNKLISKGKKEKESYSWLEVLEYGRNGKEYRSIMDFDFTKWSNDVALKKWKKEHPGEEPKYSLGIKCSVC